MEEGVGPGVVAEAEELSQRQGEGLYSRKQKSPDPGTQVARHKKAKFVDDNSAADELIKEGLSYGETYEIKAEENSQDEMRKLIESIKSEVDKINNWLKKLIEDLGKRNLSDPESPVPCKRIKAESNEQNYPHFYSASTSAPRLAPIYSVTNLVNVKTRGPKKGKTRGPKKGKTRGPKLNVPAPEPSEINLHCQSCVHIVDCDQWVQVEPSVCTDEEGSKFRISTQAGRFECSRTRMRWVCAGDVTLQYRAVDGRFLSEELERLQCERIGPVIDVTVISGKLEEAHLPHYACLAESDPSLKDAVKLLSKRNEGISLQSVELTRYHAKILQPSFSLTTLIISWFTQWEEHCNLLLYMRCKDPLILHIYFFPANDTCSKEKVEQNEKSSHPISHPRPNRPFRMKTPHLLEVPGASVHPVEGISFRTDIDPNFFEIMQHQDGDVQMNLVREEDKKSVWTATIWKAKLAQLEQRQVQDEPQLNSEIEKAQFFDKHRSALIQRVQNVKSIADKLREQRIIHEELYSEITHTNLTSQDSVRKICDTVHSSGVIAKVKFVVILQKQEPYLFEELLRSDS
ncbi:unnamed protein product [Leuciscus chuanchicus]